MIRTEKRIFDASSLPRMWWVVIPIAGLLGTVGALLIWGQGNWAASALFAAAVALTGFIFARAEMHKSSETPSSSGHTSGKELKTGFSSEKEHERSLVRCQQAAEAAAKRSKPTTQRAGDGTVFRHDRDLLRGHTVVICRKNLSPPLEEVVELYDELWTYVLREVRRRAKEKGLPRPSIVSRDLLLALARTIVLELLRSRNGRRERLRSAYNFSQDDGVRSAVERMLRKHAGCNDRMLDAICGYLFAMTSEDYHRYRMAVDHRQAGR